MLRKTSCAIAGMAITLACALATMPAKAQEVQQVLDNKLIPMSTHPWAQEVKDLDLEAVGIARVRGKVGDIISLEVMYPEEGLSIGDDKISDITLGSPAWDVYGAVNPGDDVVIGYKDGKWVYLGKSSFAAYNWITRLELKAIPQVQKVSIDWGSSQPVSLPPIQPSSAQAPVPAPAPEPIRGMW